MNIRYEWTSEGKQKCQRQSMGDVAGLYVKKVSI